MFGESCYNTAHWVFAMKYWTLAYKVKLIKLRKDPDKHNSKFLVIFVVGIILNILCAVFNQCALSYRLSDKVVQLTITALVFTLPLFVSWILLTDAFRRFRNTKSSEQVINNMKVFALSFSYLFYAIGIITGQLVSLHIELTQQREGK